VDEVGQITSIIEDHVERFATTESGNGLIDTPEVLFFRLALPSEDRDTGGGDAESQSNLLGINETNLNRTYAAAAWSWVEKMF